MGRATDVNQHSMKSDWTSKDKSTWNWHQIFLDYADAYPVSPGKPLPIHPKTDRIPYMAQLSQHRFVLVFACIPILLQQACVYLTGHNLGPWPTFFLYNIAYTINAIHESHMFRNIAYEHGCLDGDTTDRDGIPNTGAGKIIGSLQKLAALRIGLATFATYQPQLSPVDAISDVSSWLPFLVKLSLYGLILDFWFYIYHRACHEVPSLWKYHRTHHLAKHPSPIHTGWADDEQEIIEMFIVPLLTFGTFWAIGLPLGFYEWWLCLEYLTYSEILGHSGIRVHAVVVSPISSLHQLCGTELAVEDHDLHHRTGWRKSFNYGKNSMVWDKLFNTCTDRLEAKASNIDFDRVVWMPLY